MYLHVLPCFSMYMYVFFKIISEGAANKYVYICIYMFFHVFVCICMFSYVLHMYLYVFACICMDLHVFLCIINNNTYENIQIHINTWEYIYSISYYLYIHAYI